MNVIKGLIIKDFQTIKSYKTTVLFMIILFAACSFLNNDFMYFFPIFMPLCFEMLGISSFSYDNLAKSDEYLLTFPINKKDVVKARYIYILFATLLGALLGFIFVLIAQGIKTSNFFDTEVLSSAAASIVGSLIAMIFLQAIQIPIMYKYGAEKGRIIQVIIVVILMISISLITTTVMKFYENSLESLMTMLKNYLIMIIGSIIAIVYISSFLISCKIYEKKEI